MNRVESQKWIKEAFHHALRRPWMSLGLFAALVTVTVILSQNLAGMPTYVFKTPVRLGFGGGWGGFAATAIGALPALFIRAVPAKVEDSMLGFAAGMMLAASSFSLIIPGMDAGTLIYSSKVYGSLLVVAGMIIGVFLMLGLEAFTPHNHQNAGSFGPGHQAYGGMMLFVFAIALHNLPEGMAFGVSFSKGDMAVGLPVSTAIAIQDVPEGLAVALALRGVVKQAWKAVLIAAMTGALEPLGALLGVFLAGGLPFAYPMAMGISAGAMIFVVSHEVIPETHRNGHQTFATIGLMVGFIMMMILDTALG
jgi:ZIP family zinc transporter